MDWRNWDGSWREATLPSERQKEGLSGVQTFEQKLEEILRTLYLIDNEEYREKLVKLTCHIFRLQRNALGKEDMPFKVQPFPRMWDSLTNLQKYLITDAYGITAIPSNWLMLWAFCPSCSTEENKVWVPNENPPREGNVGSELVVKPSLPYRHAVASLHLEHCPLFADCREELQETSKRLGMS